MIGKERERVEEGERECEMECRASLGILFIHGSLYIDIMYCMLISQGLNA